MNAINKINFGVLPANPYNKTSIPVIPHEITSSQVNQSNDIKSKIGILALCSGGLGFLLFGCYELIEKKVPVALKAGVCAVWAGLFFGLIHYIQKIKNQVDKNNLKITG